MYIGSVLSNMTDDQWTTLKAIAPLLSVLVALVSATVAAVTATLVARYNAKRASELAVKNAFRAHAVEELKPIRQSLDKFIDAVDDVAFRALKKEGLDHQRVTKDGEFLLQPSTAHGLQRYVFSEYTQLNMVSELIEETTKFAELLQSLEKRPSDGSPKWPPSDEGAIIDRQHRILNRAKALRDLVSQAPFNTAT